MGVAERVADPPEPEQAGVRVGGVGEPLEHHREQGALDRRGPGDARGHRLEVPQRRRRVLVAECREPGRGRLGREPNVVAGDPRHRAEQRPVEQLLVQPAHLAAVVAPLLLELDHRVLRVVERAAEAAQRLVVVGYDMGAAELEELDAVLEAAQERVGLVHGLAVLAPDVAAFGQPGEGAQRGRHLEARVATAVHHLEQLDRELDVPQATGAELELTLGLLRGQVLEHPASHRLDVADEPVAAGGRPDHRPHHGDVLPAEVQVAGDRPGLEQGLELPGLRPALVVAAVAGQGADQVAGLALGAEVGVDRPDGALGGVVGADLHHLGGELGGGPRGHGVRGVVDRLVDEDDVDVADVVELAAAALAHRDHREPGRGRGRTDADAGDGQGRVEGAGGQVGQLGGDVVDTDVVGEVAGGQPEQDPAVLDA